MAEKKLTAGQPLASVLYKASFINKMVDVVNWYEGQRGGGGVSKTVPPWTDTVKVRNLTGAARARGEVVQLGDYLLDPIDFRALWFEGNTVAAPVTRKIAILREPLPEDAIGLSQVSGACVARVNVGATTHTHAMPAVGSAVLTSCYGAGSFEILSAPGSTGEQDVAVLFVPILPLLGKTDSAHAKGASGTVSVWIGTPGSETDSTLNVTAYNRFADIASGAWVWLNHNGYGWYETAAEC